MVSGEALQLFSKRFTFICFILVFIHRSCADNAGGVVFWLYACVRAIGAHSAADSLAFPGVDAFHHRPVGDYRLLSGKALNVKHNVDYFLNSIRIFLSMHL